LIRGDKCHLLTMDWDLWHSSS